MAIQIDIDGYGILANCDGLTDSAGGTWSEVGAGGQSLTTDTYLYGISCIAGSYSNKKGWQVLDKGAGNELDFSPGGTEEGQYIWIWVHCPTLGLLTDPTVDGIDEIGLAIQIGTTETDFRSWILANNEIGVGWNGWDGAWKCVIIDPRKAGSITDSGTFNLASLRHFGVYMSVNATAKGDNVFIDQISVGYGINVAGTSTTGWLDVVNYCTDYPNRAYGMFQEREGINYAYGTITIGNSGTINTSFTDSGRIIQYGTSQYHDGTNWVSTFPVSGSGIIIEDNATYSTTFGDGVLVGADAGRSGSSFIGNDDQDVRLDFYGGNHTGSVTALYGTTIKSMYGSIEFGDDPDHKIFSVGFQDCSQVIPDALSGSPVMRNVGFAETVSLSGALLWTDDIDIEECAFIANTIGPAIQVPIADENDEVNFTDLTFDGNTYDVFNTTGVPITANKLGTSDPTSYDPSGDLVTFYASYSHTLVGLELNTEVTYALTGDRTVVFHVEDATVSDGTGKYKTVYTHGGGEIVDILVHHLDYQPDISCIYDITLPSTNTTVKISMFPDLNTTW